MGKCFGPLYAGRVFLVYAFFHPEALSRPLVEKHVGKTFNSLKHKETQRCLILLISLS